MYNLDKHQSSRFNDSCKVTGLPVWWKLKKLICLI